MAGPSTRASRNRRRDPQLGGATLVDQLLAIADQRPQLAGILGGEPDLRQVADADQISEHLGIGEVRLVGTLLHPVDVARVRQVEVPAVAADQFVGQVGRPAAGLDGGAD